VDKAHTWKGTATGAGVGLTLGTIIGYLVDGWRGAGIGAVAGGAVGTGAGNTVARASNIFTALQESGAKSVIK
jgi:hypothetical protein